MAFNIFYNVPKTPEDALSYGIRAKLPIKRGCPNLHPVFILNESDSWNCRLCGADQKYNIPFKRGVVIPFQTNLPDNRNINPENLVFGVKDTLNQTNFLIQIELQDETGTTIFDLADLFCSEYNVAYTENLGSFQTWFVNTALFPVSLTCWRLKISYYKLDQISNTQILEREIFTEYFSEIIDCSKNYVDVVSSYGFTDCIGLFYGEFNNFLGTSNLPYYNYILLEGEKEFIGSDSQIESQADSGKVLRKEKVDNYQIKGGLVAPFYAKMLDITLNGSSVFVEEVEYINFSFGKNNDSSKMWVIDITFQKTCNLDNLNCSL